MPFKHSTAPTKRHKSSVFDLILFFSPDCVVLLSKTPARSICITGTIDVYFLDLSWILFVSSELHRQTNNAVE